MSKSEAAYNVMYIYIYNVVVNKYMFNRMQNFLCFVPRSVPAGVCGAVWYCIEWGYSTYDDVTYAYDDVTYAYDDVTALNEVNLIPNLI